VNVLLTGASGFVGQYLVNFFLEKKFNVSSLGRSEVANVTNYILPHHWGNNDITRIIAEAKPDYLFHLAGNSQSNSCLESFNINTCFGLNLLEALSATGLNQKTKCLFFGSAAEYGLVEDAESPLSESINCRPYSYYGSSKLAQTQYAATWGKLKGQIVIVRPFTVLGKNMSDKMAIGNFARQINEIGKTGKKGILHTGNIDISRDFVDVSDVVELCWKLVNLDDANGQVVNICSGKPTSLREMIGYMINLASVDISLKTEEKRLIKVDVRTHFGDNKKLLGLVGNFEFIPWKVSVKKMLGAS
jgi:nucleoside-diphosphate-sugar epimerase